jgi:hypothetical protein
VQVSLPRVSVRLLTDPKVTRAVSPTHLGGRVVPMAVSRISGYDQVTVQVHV